MAEISGGDKLASALADISRKLLRGSLKVGFLKGATYPDGTNVAMVAAIQDFGAPAAGIPPRPFFRNMISIKSREWAPAIGNLLKSTNYDVKRTLGQAGEGIASQLQQSIIDTNDPPLKEATIKRKGFVKPLIDTSHMINSVGYDVDGERFEASQTTYNPRG